MPKPSLMEYGNNDVNGHNYFINMTCDTTAQYVIISKHRASVFSVWKLTRSDPVFFVKVLVLHVYVRTPAVLS